ncbi:hypothetical protein BGZ63DRAFT_368305 [Mariannaea sp. PMI_226]|nr:hypothetical protein BGZ63DRAFT_368305 [Mariannaea sp. PMI_226]
MISELNLLQDRHKAAYALAQLVEQDGAGSWPPSASFVSWPKSLQCYQNIYHELFRSFTVEEPSLCDDFNRQKRYEFRALMQKRLHEKVDLTEVGEIMKSIEQGNWSIMPRLQFNALYSIIAYLRHAYRWAANPVVRVAQLERFVKFPDQLEIPWQTLQKVFGCVADSGNHTANVLLAFDTAGSQIIRTNIGVSARITSTEHNFFLLFYIWEVKSVPIYVEIVRAVIAFEQGQIKACANGVRKINALVRELFSIFYKNLVHQRVSRDVWLQYTQGFHGWGAGKVVDAQLMEYEGVSGSHVLAFQILDSFLNLKPYLSEQELSCYVPAKQREFSNQVRRHSFRFKIDKDTNEEIYNEMERLVQQMKFFRLGHRKRVMPYLKQPAPERRHMTAGKYIQGEGSIDDALRPLNDMLVRRVVDTV